MINPSHLLTIPHPLERILPILTKFFGNSKRQEIIVQTDYISPAYQLF